MTAANEDIVRVMLAVADSSLPKIALAAGFREWMRAIHRTDDPTALPEP